MNILYYDRFQIEGFSSIHIYEVSANLSKLGHNIVGLSPDSPRPRAATEASTRLSLWKRIKGTLRSLPIYKLLRGEIWILWLLWHEISLFLSAFLLLVKQRGRFDVIYRRGSLFGSEYFLARLFHLSSVKEVNGIVADEMKIGKKSDWLSLWIIDRIEKWNIPKADRIIVVTSKLKQVLRDDYHVPEDKIVVIWNGANTDLFKPTDATAARAELGLKQGDNYVCFVGSLSPWQGVEYLIQSAPLVLAEYPNTQFLVVGHGAMREELTNLAEQIGVSDRFVFTGLVPYEQVPLYINASDVCALPKGPMRSGYSPLKLCEYMACQKPVVASAISGLEIIESYHAGILVPPEKPQELAPAIIKLLQDPELREKMGGNGRKYVVENRSWSSVARKVAEVCQQTVQERRDKGQKTKEP